MILCSWVNQPADFAPGDLNWRVGRAPVCAARSPHEVLGLLPKEKTMALIGGNRLGEGGMGETVVRSSSWLLEDLA